MDNLLWIAAMSVKIGFKLCLSVMLFNICSVFAANTTLFGNSESVILSPGNITLEAKLDTGAESASLDATQIEEFEKDDQKWVSFKVPLRQAGKVVLIPIELPLEKYTYIKSRTGEMGDQKLTTFKRPTVKMFVCLGSEEKQVLVNLANRSHFTYSMILGRTTIMQFNGVVDPKLRNTQKPNCEKNAES